MKAYLSEVYFVKLKIVEFGRLALNDISHTIESD